MAQHSDCTKCSLYSNAYTVGMNGRGPQPAKVMLVAMSPGLHEDTQGTPLVGPSGKFLDDMLRDAGIDMRELRLTNSVRCVLGSSAVLFPSPPTIGYRRYTEDPVIRIVCADGSNLTVTPNHPVLTQRGWIAAELVQADFDRLYDCNGIIGSESVKPQIDNVPTTAEQVFASLKQMGHISGIVGGPMNFHGDVIRESEVEIVGAYGNLLTNFILDQPILDEKLAGRLLTFAAASSSSSIDSTGALLQNSMCRPQLSRFMRARDSSLDLRLGKSSHHQSFAFAETSDGYFKILHRPTDSLLAAAAINADLTHSLPSGISSRDVILVEKLDFSGHVYNFSTLEGWYTSDQFIVHNCLPPKNKVFPAYIEACREWLIEEIHETQPTLIICMGDVALRSLCKKPGIMGKRGQTLQLHKAFGYASPKTEEDLARFREANMTDEQIAALTCDVFVTLHPSYVLRVPQMRETVVSDLTRLHSFGKTNPPVPWDWWEGVVPEAPMLSYDVETSYFQDKGSTVIQCAVTGIVEGVETTYVARQPDDIRSMLLAIEGAGKPLLTFNGWRADVPWCDTFLASPLGGGPSDVQMSVGEDAMVMLYIQDETQPRSLESACVRYLGVVGWKEGLHADPNSDEFAEYNARDSSYTLRLHDFLVKEIGERRRIIDVVMRPAHEALVSASKRGIFIDEDAVDIADAHYVPIMEEKRARLIELAPEDAPLTNPNSPDQIGAALIAEGHILPLTDQGKPSTAAPAIAELTQTPFTEALTEYREASKLVGTYIKPYKRVCQGITGRAHSQYSLLQVTGRSSARSMNVQNLPRDPLLRAFFAAPPGKELLEIDYSSIEFRIAAMIANERGILERYAINPDWDAHTFVACAYFGIDQAEGLALKDAKDKDFLYKRNDVAKSANFGLLFGSSAHGLYEYAKKVGAKLTIEECANLRNFWHATFPGFTRYYVETYEEIKAQGYVESLTGRRRHVGNVEIMSRQNRADALREAVNFKVQSLAADIALTGVGLCHKYKQPIVAFVHDANYFEYAIGESEKKYPALKFLMVDESLKILREEFGCEITVPILVEKKIKRYEPLHSEVQVYA